MKLYNTAITALFSAFIVICAWISVPFLGVPFTLQTLGVFVCIGVLRFRRGFSAVFIYVLLGIVGLPVFHGFQGGWGVLLGSTGGFIMGFLLSAIPICLITNKSNSFSRLVLGFAAAQAVCYITGVLWYMYVFDGGKGLGGILLTAVVPFLLFDAIKIVVSAVIVKKVSKYVK